jgi:aspartate aminotransferase-like enzyme
MRLEVFAQHPVDSLTAIAFPDNVDVAAFQRQMREELGIIVSGGQGSLKNKIVRINHMGYVDETDTIATIAAMELTLTRLGHKFPTAAGTKAALNVLVNVD